jgi:hypothetical protein
LRERAGSAAHSCGRSAGSRAGAPFQAPHSTCEPPQLVIP